MTDDNWTGARPGGETCKFRLRRLGDGLRQANGDPPSLATPLDLLEVLRRLER